jgi:hypothetical protein
MTPTTMGFKRGINDNKIREMIVGTNLVISAKCRYLNDVQFVLFRVMHVVASRHSRLRQCTHKKK